MTAASLDRIADRHVIETVCSRSCAGRDYPTVQRMGVPGGWLYEVIAYNRISPVQGSDYLVVVAISTSFVPDVQNG